MNIIDQLITMAIKKFGFPVLRIELRRKEKTFSAIQGWGSFILDRFLMRVSIREMKRTLSARIQCATRHRSSVDEIVVDLRRYFPVPFLFPFDFLLSDADSAIISQDDPSNHN